MRYFLLFTLSVCLVLDSMAQLAPNDTVIQQLAHNYLRTHPGPYMQIDGLQPAVWPSEIIIDATVTDRLTFLPAIVSYTTLSKGKYIRRVQLPYVQESAAMQQDSLHFQDTLTRKQLRQVLRQSSLATQGEDPRKWGRWGRASMIMGGSVLGIWMLFVLRSR